MTEEQAQRLYKLRYAIRDRSASGQTATDMAQLYTELSGNRADLWCKPCVGAMLDYLTNKLVQYEKEQAKAQYEGC